MQKNEPALPPPVPPRRKRSKIKSKQFISTSPHVKVEHKHRPPPPIPPPAAPQRAKIGRKTPSPSSTQNISSELPNSIELIPDNNSEALKDNLPSSQYKKVNILEESKKSPKTTSAKKLDSDKIQASRSNSPFSLSNETNNYPPLYFTFQDYQTVMEDSSSLRKENSDKISDQVEEKQRAIATPFLENIIFHNEREEIYFRVTTTDRPFEKCLEEWTKDYDEGMQEFKEEQQPDFYIFEDYIDRSKKLNARPHLLFTEDFFSIPQNDNSASTERSTTRVRFLLESPSTSTPDLDLDDDTTNYADLIDKKFENREKSSVQLLEVTDELQSTEGNTNETASEVIDETKMELETVEDEILSESLYELTPNQINDSFSDWEDDAEVYSFPTNSEIHTKVSSFSQENKDKLELKEYVDENINLQKQVIELVNEKESTISNKEIQETSETTKIFIDSSFYDLSNSKIDSKVDALKTANIQVDSNTELLIIPKIVEPTNFYDDNATEKHIFDAEQCNETDQTEKVEELQDDKKSSVPAYDRLSNFLEAMLNENENDKKSEKSIVMNCEVIAAHPKQDSNLARNEENTTLLSDRVLATTESETMAKDNSQTNMTDSGLKSKAVKRINMNLNNNKSAGEIKGDVLNELVTNFNTIKLKPVNKNSQESSWLHELKSERKGENNAVDIKTDTIHKVRKEIDTTECKNEKKNKLELKSKEIIQNSLKEEEEHNANASINKDVCAIIKEAPYVQRIENDNKTTTPVIVSKDQYREAVSITPGSVRSFVKYYEIHSEISNISKIKDNAFKKQKSELSLQRERKAGKKSTKAFEKNMKTSNNSTLKAETKVKEKEKTNSQSRKVSLQQLSPCSKSRPFTQKQSCMKSLIPSPKPESKKSVQFDNDHTVISPRKNEKGKEKEEEEGTFSSFIGGIRTRLKGKAPAKPEIKKVEPPKISKQAQWRNDSAAIFCIQKSPEAKTVACTAKSGNIGFLPQSETLQNNQTIVFYCTV